MYTDGPAPQRSFLGHDGGSIWVARQFSFAGHPSSAFPKDTAEATFWANWSTTALGAFPTAFHWQDGMLAFFCERRTIAARIHSFANARSGTSAIAALGLERHCGAVPSTIGENRGRRC